MGIRVKELSTMEQARLDKLDRIYGDNSNSLMTIEMLKQIEQIKVLRKIDKYERLNIGTAQEIVELLNKG